MPPSDSRRSRALVMSSHRPLIPRHALVPDHFVGSLRFLGGSVDARCPLPPRRARPLQVLITSRSVSGFALSGGLAAPTCVTRPKRVHAFALRLTSLSSRASTTRSPRPPPSRLHGERAIPMVSSFQLTRSTRLRLTHQRTRRRQELLDSSACSASLRDLCVKLFDFDSDFAILPREPHWRDAPLGR